MNELSVMLKGAARAYIEGKQAEALGGAFVTDGADGSSLTLESIGAAIAVFNQAREIYYRVDTFTPNDEVWLLSAGKKVMVLPPDFEASFVEQATRAGFIAVRLDLENEQHRQLWLDAMREALMIPRDELFVKGFGSPLMETVRSY